VVTDFKGLIAALGSEEVDYLDLAEIAELRRRATPSSDL